VTEIRTASVLLDVLRRHYLPESRPPGGVFAPEIESPCGKRRADALWMPTTYAGSKALVGHEIKVTRADVLTELADPTKCDAWARYCGHWWLVIPHPALIDGLDHRIPDHWGVMAPPSGRRTRTMTVLRPAPRLHPVDAGPAFRRVAVWLHNRDHARAAELAQELRWRTQERDQARSGAGRSGDRRAEQIGRILRGVESGIRERGLYHDPDEATVIAAILDHTHVAQAADSARYDLDRLIQAARTLAEPMTETRRALQKLQGQRAAAAAHPAAVPVSEAS
jgi:hypothetical protein